MFIYGVLIEYINDTFLESQWNTGAFYAGNFREW
jgi:hypothetical protein